MTIDIVQELWQARSNLSKTGASGHIKNSSDADAPLETWNQFY